MTFAARISLSLSLFPYRYKNDGAKCNPAWKHFFLSLCILLLNHKKVDDESLNSKKQLEVADMYNYIILRRKQILKKFEPTTESVPSWSTLEKIYNWKQIRDWFPPSDHPAPRAPSDLLRPPPLTFPLDPPRIPKWFQKCIELITLMLWYQPAVSMPLLSIWLRLWVPKLNKVRGTL